MIAGGNGFYRAEKWRRMSKSRRERVNERIGRRGDVGRENGREEKIQKQRGTEGEVVESLSTGIAIHKIR